MNSPGITPIPYEARLQNWVERATNEIEKNKRVVAKEKILKALRTNAEKLGLSGLNLTDVPPLDALANLKDLDLSNNELSTLPRGCFTGLTSLEYLNLKENQLSTLPPGCFTGLDSLTNLFLAKNQLSTLPPGCFTGLTALILLHLDQNHLSTLPPGCFIGLNSLKYLFLNRNQLNTLPPGCFIGLTSLQNANLDKNFLKNGNILKINNREFQIDNQNTHGDLMKEIKEVNEKLRTTLPRILNHLQRREKIGIQIMSTEQRRLLNTLNHLMTIGSGAKSAE